MLVIIHKQRSFTANTDPKKHLKAVKSWPAALNTTKNHGFSGGFAHIWDHRMGTVFPVLGG